MPTPGKNWFHITLGTLGSWLPGDPRGFRSKTDNIHSSGDHRNPPPPGEHAGLLNYSKQLKPHATLIPMPLRPVIGEAIVNNATQRGHQLAAMSVAAMHVHMLIELPRHDTAAIIGKVKRHGSIAVTKTMPGRLWAEGCGIKPIKDKAHQVNTFNYILRHQEQGAWVWTFKMK